MRMSGSYRLWTSAALRSSRRVAATRQALRPLTRPHLQISDTAAASFEPNPGGRAGADDVSGKQRHKFAHVRQESRNFKNHIRGGTVLANLSINFEPHS